MPTPKVPPKPENLAYIQNTLMQDQDGDIRNRSTLKSALKPTPARTFLVYCGNSRYFPAQDVAWYLQTGEWPKVDTWIKLVDNGKPWTPAHLLPGNLYPHTPGKLSSYVAELERVHVKPFKVAVYPDEVAAQSEENQIYDATLYDATQWFKTGFNLLLPSLRPRFINDVLTADERKAMGNIENAVRAVSEVQDWDFSAMQYMRMPGEEATARDFLAWAKRCARAIDPDMRGVDEETFAAICGPASAIFD